MTLKIAQSVNGGSSFSATTLTPTVVSDENEGGASGDFCLDYLVHIGLDINQGTIQTRFTFETFESGSDIYDTEAVHVSARRGGERRLFCTRQ